MIKYQDTSGFVHWKTFNKNLLCLIKILKIWKSIFANQCNKYIIYIILYNLSNCRPLFWNHPWPTFVYTSLWLYHTILEMVPAFEPAVNWQMFVPCTGRQIWKKCNIIDLALFQTSVWEWMVYLTLLNQKWLFQISTLAFGMYLHGSIVCFERNV